MNRCAVESEKAIFAAGCFWGVEQFFQDIKGVQATKVGYTGGCLQNPTYQEVSSGKTGHVEAAEVLFNPAEISFETLVKLFFEIHNPALISNVSGKRSQYRSAIFYRNPEQKAIVKKLVEQLQDMKMIVYTEIKPAGEFNRAEEYHQKYYTKKGKAYKVRRCTPRFS